jgi:hypothetical protein
VYDARVMTRYVVSIITAALMSASALAQDKAGRVIVNGQALPAKTVQELEKAYQVPIAGQMMPGLRLGGALRANASRGDSGVFINGRELTKREVP